LEEHQQSVQSFLIGESAAAVLDPISHLA